MSRDMYANVSVIEPVEKAIHEVKKILFQPFNLEKWFIIGFCAWLAFLGSGGGGGGGGGGNGPNFNTPTGPNAAHEMEQAKEWIISNLYWIIPVAIALMIIFILIGLVMTWLSSRGQFMFLHCVAQNKAEVAIPWTKYKEHGNSLFLFRLVLGFISFFVIILYLVAAGICIFALSGGSGGQVNVPMIIGIIVGVFGLICLAVVFFVIKKLTLDFVTPIMYLRSPGCMAAWGEFMEILSARKGALILYLLFQIVIGIATGALVAAFALLTCGCACCFMALPYIGTVVLLPILVFDRSYSLHYLRQFGSDFDVFVPEEAVEVLIPQ